MSRNYVLVMAAAGDVRAMRFAACLVAGKPVASLTTWPLDWCSKSDRMAVLERHFRVKSAGCRSVIAGQSAETTAPPSVACGAVFRYDLKTQESNVLFHVSKEPGIAEFTPPPSKYTSDPVVWASAHRWHVEIRLEKPADVDRQLTTWLNAAYQLAGERSQ